MRHERPAAGGGDRDVYRETVIIVIIADTAPSAKGYTAAIIIIIRAGCCTLGHTYHPATCSR